MSRLFAAFALVWALLAVGCAPPLRASSPHAARAGFARFAAVPALDVPWSPPSLVAAEAEAWGELARALAAATRVEVRAAPETAIAPEDLRALARRLAPGVKVRGGTGARLVLEPARGLSPEEWAARPAVLRGSCEALTRALARGQEEALARLEPALARVMTAADRAVRARLRREGAATLESVPRRCSATRRAVRACLADEVCPLTPRPVLRGRLRIAAPVPADTDPSCGPEGAGELWRAVERAAEEAVRDNLAPAWVDAADRQAARVALAEALADACTPARRRYDPRLLQEIRAEVRLAGEDLRREEPPPAVSWRAVGEPVHVPGLGPARALLVLADGPAPGPAGRVREASLVIRRRLAEGARCVPLRAGVPLRLALLAGAPPKVQAEVFVYPEELVCEELGPEVPVPSPR